MLYWSDGTNATISMMHTDAYKSTIVVSRQSMYASIRDQHFSPRSLAVDPVIRLAVTPDYALFAIDIESSVLNVYVYFSAQIFWIDCCLKPRIWSADLDGSNPRVLTDRVAWPKSLVCDVSNERLYWTDAKQKTVNTITTSGLDQRVIYKFTSQFSIYRVKKLKVAEF